MESSEIVRSLIVLTCIFNPLPLLAASSREAQAQYHANRSKIFSMALCGALLIVIALYFLSVTISFLLLEGPSVTFTCGAILIVFAARDFQRRSANFASKNRQPSERPDRSHLFDVATIPSIAAISFVISETHGSPAIYFYALLAVISSGYFALLGSIFYRRGGGIRPEFASLRRIPSSIVLIVAIDMILISLWP